MLKYLPKWKTLLVIIWLDFIGLSALTLWLVAKDQTVLGYPPQIEGNNTLAEVFLLVAMILLILSYAVWKHRKKISLWREGTSDRR